MGRSPRSSKWPLHPPKVQIPVPEPLDPVGVGLGADDVADALERPREEGRGVREAGAVGVDGVAAVLVGRRMEEDEKPSP